MKHLFFLASLLFVINVQAGDPLVKCLKKKVEGISSITPLGPKGGFSQVYDIRLIQPLDHDHPEKGTFEQRIYLYHKDRKKPTLMVTDGYQLYDRIYELTDILDANQLIVEYRFYGESGSDNIQWEYLNNTEAAADLHRIRTTFGKVYKKEWVTTGISKGGTTTMIYKALYPDDADASVNYVGPLPLAQEDKRMDEHIKTVGDRDCRKKLTDFQRLALKKRDLLLPKLDSLAKADNLTFSIGLGKAFEYAVLEYTFSFWQFAHNCNDIPNKTASNDVIFNHLNDVVGFNFYSDATVAQLGNAFYQFMGENGYYGFIHDHVDDLLKYEKTPSNMTFVPKNVPLKYDGTFMLDIDQRLKADGDKMIHIHGGLDPWGAVGFFPATHQDALLLIKPDGGHRTRIKNLSEDQKKQVYSALDKWLKARVHPLAQDKS